LKSIQNKILLVVISGLLVITAIVSAIAVNMTHKIMHKDADRILNNVTLKEAALINDQLGDIKKSANIMQHYAKSEIDDLEKLKNPEFRAAYLDKTKKMFSEIAVNTSGIKGYFFRVNPEFSDSTTGYYNLLSEDLTVKEMPVTDLSKYPENDVKNVGWYYTSIKKGEATWLDPYFFPGYDLKLISYTIPLYKDGQLLGVIGFDMDFGYLVNTINNISVYEHGSALLLAKDGKTAYNDANGEASSNPHTKATAALQNGMYLELRADYKDIQHEIHPMLFNIVLAFIVVLIVAIIYTIIVTHRIVRPLTQLTDAAKKISEGNVETDSLQITVNTKDEIGTLSAVLSETYAKIQEYTAYINALAYKDSLTNIKNTTAYSEMIKELNDGIGLNNSLFGVLVADINNLKITNDNYGHDIGNELIIRTSKLLTETFKDSPVFRVGGDEFVVILQNMDFVNHLSLLEKFDELCSKEVITVGEEKLYVSVAKGVASYNPETDKAYKDVFARADQAMYNNKEEMKKAQKNEQ